MRINYAPWLPFFGGNPQPGLKPVESFGKLTRENDMVNRPRLGDDACHLLKWEETFELNI